MAKSTVFEKNYSTRTVVIYGKEFDVKTLPESMRHNCELDGYILKLTRTTAGMKQDTYTNAERLTSIVECDDHLRKDQWTKPGTGTKDDKLVAAWDSASESERLILDKLHLRPKSR